MTLLIALLLLHHMGMLNFTSFVGTCTLWILKKFFES